MTDKCELKRLQARLREMGYTCNFIIDEQGAISEVFFRDKLWSPLSFAEHARPIARRDHREKDMENIWGYDELLKDRERLLEEHGALLKICEEIASDSRVDLVDSERRIRLYAAITKAGGKL